MTLPRHFRRNVISGYLNTGSVAVIALVTTPILVHGLGLEAYGVWVIVGSLALYREILQFGFAKATPKYVAEYSALQDEGRVRTSIATTFWILAVPGAAALLLGLGLVAAFPILFDLEPSVREAAQVLVAIMVIDLAVSIPCDAFAGTLIGLQRFDLLNWTLIAVAVAQAVAWMIVLAFGGGLVLLGVVTVAARLVGHLWRFLLARRLLPHLSISPRRADRNLVKPAAGLSIWYGIADVSDLLLTRIDTIVVGLVLGVEAAAVYAVGQKLTLVIGQLMVPISSLFFPHASELAAQGDAVRLRETLVTATRVVLGIAAPLSITMAILAGPILQTWVGSGFGDAVPVVILLAAAYATGALSAPGLVMLQGVGRARGPAAIWVSEATLNLGLSLLLAHLIGLEGVALATLLASVATNLLAYLPYVCRQFGIRFWRFVGSLLARYGPPVSAALATGWLMIRGNPVGVVPLGAAASAILVAYAAIFSVTGLDGAERRVIRSRVRQLRF
jgi:O-antigen/teichoic acid export membrane protein